MRPLYFVNVIAGEAWESHKRGRKYYDLNRRNKLKIPL